MTISFGERASETSLRLRRGLEKHKKEVTGNRRPFCVLAFIESVALVQRLSVASFSFAAAPRAGSRCASFFCGAARHAPPSARAALAQTLAARSRSLSGDSALGWDGKVQCCVTARLYAGTAGHEGRSRRTRLGLTELHTPRAVDDEKRAPRGRVSLPYLLLAALTLEGL